ncbi:hypothetical protein TCAP_06417 [Tolypocladium capitatum]|uniref:Uncharacterized protein n=1 Tax=Tolypocladium capitatum TaxID=45235 RepID=A0A2K3Q7Z0_9HYPO|nr:hypothetical protein TCAP_06417 [Tolypocladium capitatum]
MQMELEKTPLPKPIYECTHRRPFALAFFFLVTKRTHALRPGRRDGAFVILAKRLLPVRVVPDDERARRVGAQPSPPLDGQLGGKLEAAGALDGLDGDLEVGDGLLVGYGGVGEDEGANGDAATGLAVLGEDDLVEVRGDGDGGWAADHLVLDVPLVVDGVLSGEVERPGDDADRRVLHGEAAAKVLKVRPVIAVEALADLGAHVGEVKGLIHGFLGPFGVGGGDLVAAVVAAAEVVLELAAELGGHGVVLDEGAVLAVAVADGERGGRDVLDDPLRVARAPVVARYQRRAARDV